MGIYSDIWKQELVPCEGHTNIMSVAPIIFYFKTTTQQEKLRRKKRTTVWKITPITITLFIKVGVKETISKMLNSKKNPNPVSHALNKLFSYLIVALFASLIDGIDSFAIVFSKVSRFSLSVEPLLMLRKCANLEYVPTTLPRKLCIHLWTILRHYGLT